MTYNDDDAKGKTTTWAAYSDPNIVSLTNVDFYAKFSITNKVPAGGLIKIKQSPLSFTLGTTATTNKNVCWMNYKHSSCTVSGSTMTFVVEEEVSSTTAVEIYLDGGVTNRSETAASANGFRVETSWESVVIDDDTTDITGSNFTSKAALTKTVTKGTSPIVADPTTAGEWASYKFTFTLGQTFAATDKILIWFPMTYDPFIGRASVKYA
jgi:hypothetical protein